MMFSTFLSNPIVSSVIGILGLFTGILVSYIFYRKSRIEKKPLYCIITDTLLENSDASLNHELKIYYKGIETDIFRRSILLFLNNGKTSIRKTDLFKDNRLRLHFNDSPQKIHRINYASTSKVKQSFSVKQIESDIIIDFDAIQKGQGFIITIYHSALSNQPITLDGDIEGVKKIKRISKQRMALILNPNIESTKKDIKRNIIISGIAITVTIAFLIPKSSINYLALFSGTIALSFLMPSIFGYLETISVKKFTEFAKLNTNNSFEGSHV